MMMMRRRKRRQCNSETIERQRQSWPRLFIMHFIMCGTSDSFSSSFRGHIKKAISPVFILLIHIQVQATNALWSSVATQHTIPTVALSRSQRRGWDTFSHKTLATSIQVWLMTSMWFKVIMSVFDPCCCTAVISGLSDQLIWPVPSMPRVCTYSTLGSTVGCLIVSGLLMSVFFVPN